MKVTTLRDNGKVNQIVPIMQEHLGSVMNLARIKLLAFVLQALCVVQTVSLHKIASAMPTCVERDSNLRRLQRFLAGYALNLDLIAKVIFALLPVKTGLVLSLDRTNWNSVRSTSISSCLVSLTRVLPFLCSLPCSTNAAIPTGKNGRG